MVAPNFIRQAQFNKNLVDNRYYGSKKSWSISLEEPVGRLQRVNKKCHENMMIECIPCPICPTFFTPLLLLPTDPKMMLLNDIAVLTLKNQATFDDKVERVCLMTDEIEKVNIITASPPPPVTISGWGLMNDSDVLQKADIPFVSTEKDKCKWDTDFAGRLCAGELNDSGVRAGACVGDIGGEESDGFIELKVIFGTLPALSITYYMIFKDH